VIVQDLNVPLIVQPQLFGLFSLLSWGQCMYYGGARSRVWCAVVLGGTLVVWGALEAGLVFALRVRVFFPCEGRKEGRNGAPISLFSHPAFCFTC
jgi:hypothetical protein